MLSYKKDEIPKIFQVVGVLINLEQEEEDWKEGDLQGVHVECLKIERSTRIPLLLNNLFSLIL